MAVNSAKNTSKRPTEVMELKQGMKYKVPSKASKASLVARGLASNSKPPAAVKRPLKGQKGHQRPAKDSKPGYALYTSDSEDQASAVDRGLNRCAALLSNIMDNEDKVTSKRVSAVKPTKSNIKRAPTSHSTLRSGKQDAQKTNTMSGRVVIPTARPDDKANPSPSRSQEETNQAFATTYNDRLVSSTPVPTVEERQKRQQLQIREAQLQQEILQLKERYELLQRQQSPSHHEEQKLLLQNSMMQQLENHQKSEDKLPRNTVTKHSLEGQSFIGSRGEKLSDSSPQRSSARRSLDYSGFHVEKDLGGVNSLKNNLSEFQSGLTNKLLREGRKTDVAKQFDDDSMTQKVDSSVPKKRVRIVSPVTATSVRMGDETLSSPVFQENLSGVHVRVSSSDADPIHEQVTPSTPSPPSRHSSNSVRSRDTMAPSSADNHFRMIQYLVDELRALIGNTGDLEVDRLLTEIDDAVKLLPFLVEKDKTATASRDIEQALQPYKVENDQLRRRLLIAHQKLKEGSLKKYEDKSSVKTDLAFELAACRSVNGVLQKQLTEEKNNKEMIIRHRDQLSQNLSELQEEKKKFLDILSNKGQDFLRLKREWQQDTSKLTVENKKLQADLEALQLSTEAEKKEISILNLSLKQKDAEIDRLKELTGGLQQSLTRLLSDIQQFQPKDFLKTGLLHTKGIAFDGLDERIGSSTKTTGQTTALKLLPLDDVPFAERRDGNSSTPNTASSAGNPSTVGRNEEFLLNETRNRRSVAQRKHLRFADGPSSHPKPEFSLTSGLSPEAVKGSEGSVEFFEGSSNTDSFSSPSVLEIKDLEDVQIDGEVSPLSSGEDEDFRKGLENLDANIARIQKSLRETALKT
ncbi:coiled-coil domain-containing protein 14-like isoform X2 [Montipora foliosa]|uniref:coiled-coil domain-containing protein 14-like isoform X2 n=1 Tax=Montipora foliosa TaxID=591990 RepID=UPI0035F1C5E0